MATARPSFLHSIRRIGASPIEVAWYAVATSLPIKIITEFTTYNIAWRYDPGLILFNCALVVIICITIWKLIKNIRTINWKYGMISIANLSISFFLLTAGGFTWNQYPQYLCGKRVGCYFISVLPIPTDTVYMLWHSSSYWSFYLNRYLSETDLEYSEDGKYTENPKLRLSNNEHILVLNRGGLNFDAIDLRRNQVISLNRTSWDDPEFDKIVTENSKAIENILWENSK